MSHKRSRPSTIFVVTATNYRDDYKTRGDDWSSSTPQSFSSKEVAEKYARKLYRRKLRERTRGSDYKDSDTSEFAERARKRDAFLAEKYHGNFSMWVSEAEELLQGEFARCTFTAEISEQDVYDDCTDSEDGKAPRRPKRSLTNT